MPDFVIITHGIPQKNSQRVIRGGSWINNERNLRSANRNANTPDNRNHNNGLRLAGALLNTIGYQAKRKERGSINQRYFQMADFKRKLHQNQGPQRVSRQFTKSLLLGHPFFSGRCSYVN